MDADRNLAELAAERHGVFTFEDARTAGFTKRQVDRRIGRSWTVEFDGVYRIAGSPRTWRSQLRAALVAAGSHAAISHRSAAALYELPGGRDDLVELTCPLWKRTIQPNLVVHESRRLDTRDTQILDGLTVTRPERVLLEMASIYPSPRYLEVLIQAARRKRLLTYESTNELFVRHARRGLKGVRALRGALELWDPTNRPTDSDMETLTLQALRDHGLPDPETQYEVRDAAGSVIGRVDLAYPAQHILIEYDSKQEHTDEFQIARDAHRRNGLQVAGYVVLSARHRDVKSGGTELCAHIKRMLRRSKAELS